MDREGRGGQGRSERPIARGEVGTGSRQQFDRQHEKEGGVRGVPEDADEVVAPGFQPPDGELGRVEEPGQRLIDPEQRGLPCPAELRPAEPAEMRVRQEVRPVIPGRREAILQRGGERQRRQQAERTDDRGPATVSAPSRFLVLSYVEFLASINRR